jgi:uncharacterized membrane protein
MKAFARYFLRGLVIVTPAALTLWVIWWAVSSVDRLLDVGIPGAGILVTILGITLVGALASNLVTRGVVNALDRLLERLPFARLVSWSVREWRELIFFYTATGVSLSTSSTPSPASRPSRCIPRCGRRAA